MSYFDHGEYDIRCEWGLEGMRLLSPTSDAVVVIDIFSFTTTVAVAISRGARVYPFAWRDGRLEEFARAVNAIPAIASRGDPRGLSLAPCSMLDLARGSSIVLPSPNGATLSLESGNTPLLAGCLRNATAVALAANRFGRRVSVIPAGERWPDGSLRPALEDLIGAGAVIHSLAGSRSPEARAAETIFLHFQADLLNTLKACSSGKEAADRGSQRDVELAAEINVSGLAPRLIDGAYQA